MAVKLDVKGDNKTTWDGLEATAQFGPPNPAKMNSLVRDIEAWARSKGLHEGDPVRQCAKLFEEGGELTRACIRNDKPEIIDGIGDCFVVLTIVAMRQGLNIQDCIEAAYNEIKGRQGQMVNGFFVREVNGVERQT